MATEYRPLTLRELKNYLFELDISDTDLLDRTTGELLVEYESGRRVQLVMRNEEIAFFDAPYQPVEYGEYIPDDLDDEDDLDPYLEDDDY